MGYRKVGYLEQVWYIVTWSAWTALRHFFEVVCGIPIPWKGAQP